MRDPVTGFEYPESWIELCQDQRAVRSGLGVLTSTGRVMMRGYSTGTTAAAACKAAIVSLKRPINSVEIQIPCGLRVPVIVSAEDGRATCRKYSGDYKSDLTRDLEILAIAEEIPEGITLIAGSGIGRFTRKTPRYHEGQPAISPSALSTIQRGLEEGVREVGVGGVSVVLSIPHGEELGAHTLNQKIGVSGGLSILGTTGLVEPWDDHLTESMLQRVREAKRPVLTTGRLGLRYSRLIFPERDVILVGAKIKEALTEAKGDATLCGLPALILRFIDPDILKGTGYSTIEELSASPSFQTIARSACKRFTHQYPSIDIVILNREGIPLGERP